MKFGNITIGGMSLGSIKIGGAKLGNTLVYQAGSGPAPLPYTEVEYIETDGTAYIDTGIKGNAPRSTEFKITPVAPASGNAYVYGCRKDSGNTRFALLVITSAKKPGFAYSSGAYISTIDISSSVTNGTPMDVRVVLQNGSCKLSVKQQGESSFTDYTQSVSATITTGVNIFLFAYNNMGSVGAPVAGTRFWPVKIYSDATFTTLVWDAVPCYYNGEYGMWDKVSDSFFGNAAGSGAFTGPQI